MAVYKNAPMPSSIAKRPVVNPTPALAGSRVVVCVVGATVGPAVVGAPDCAVGDRLVGAAGAGAFVVGLGDGLAVVHADLSVDICAL